MIRVPSFLLTSMFILIVIGWSTVTIMALTAKEAEKEWTLPARFEGQGAFTVGCGLWEVPLVVPYDDKNTNEGKAALLFDGETLDAFVDSYDGTFLIHGKACGISVDWRAFPTRERPGEKNGN